MLLGKDGFGESSLGADSVIGIVYATDPVAGTWAVIGYPAIAWEWITSETAFETVITQARGYPAPAVAATAPVTAAIAVTSYATASSALAQTPTELMQCRGALTQALAIASAPLAVVSVTGYAAPASASTPSSTSYVEVVGFPAFAMGATPPLTVLSGVTVYASAASAAAPEIFAPPLATGHPVAGAAIASTPSGVVWAESHVSFDAPINTGGNLIVLNAMTLGITEYAITALDIAAVQDGLLKYLTDIGVLRFDAAAPVEFEARFKTGELALVSGSVCTVTRLHAEITTLQQINVTAESHDAGNALTVSYNIPPASGLEQMRLCKLGRGAKGTAWVFTLSAAGRWTLRDLVARIERAGLGRVGAIRR